MDKGDAILDKAIVGWIHNTARQHFWRVAYWYDLSDLIADGWLCYAKCRCRYARQVFDDRRNPTPLERRKFMALVKSTYLRHITNLANRRTQLGEVPAIDIADVAQEVMAPAGLDALDKLLPPELHPLVEVMLKTDSKKRRTRLFYMPLASGGMRVKRLRKSRRETTNEYFCRLLGLDPTKNDLAGMVERALCADV